MTSESEMDFTIPVNRLGATIDRLLNDDINAPDYAFVLIVVATQGNRIVGQAAVIANMAGDATLELVTQTSEQMASFRDEVSGLSLEQTDKQRKPS